jgi:hypothetical protein
MLTYADVCCDLLEVGLARGADEVLEGVLRE